MTEHLLLGDPYMLTFRVSRLRQNAAALDAKRREACDEGANRADRPGAEAPTSGQRGSQDNALLNWSDLFGRQFRGKRIREFQAGAEQAPG